MKTAHVSVHLDPESSLRIAPFRAADGPRFSLEIQAAHTDSSIIDAGDKVHHFVVNAPVRVFLSADQLRALAELVHEAPELAPAGAST